MTTSPYTTRPGHWAIVGGALAGVVTAGLGGIWLALQILAGTGLGALAVACLIAARRSRAYDREAAALTADHLDAGYSRLRSALTRRDAR